MNRLLVASVYSPSERNRHWFRLQREFLSKTTDAPYDHAVYLCRGVDSSMFHDVLIIGREKTEHHQEALSEILRYFRSNPYDYYLILDSDAWPCRPGWLQILNYLLKRNSRIYATAIQTENMDTFPHPSLFFVKGHDSWNDPRIDFGLSECKNLMGNTFRDVGAGMNGLPVLPLLRTNVWSPHPALCGIYGHLFYHHGAGSRRFLNRSLFAGLYDHFIKPDEHEKISDRLLDQMIQNPVSFMNRLMGIEKSTERY